MPEFCHLHNHTQYSLLDGASNIKKMITKAKEDGMPAIAITDHGNMFGAFEFYREAKKQGIKPIIGCEFYVVEDRFQKSFTKEKRDKRYHQLLLAKNEIGYKNLSTLCSLGFIEGLYGKFPRIDKELLKQYSEGLIATTCCPAAEVPRTFLDHGPEAAEKKFLEWQEMFGDDYYIEVQRHNMQTLDEEGIVQFMKGLSEKYNVPMIATNDAHYVDQDDAMAHDILLCIETAAKFNDEKRFKFENDQFYVKTKAEMTAMFQDMPQAVENTILVAEKVETPELARDILLPNFGLPEGFETEDDYLRHLCYEGAKKKYSELSSVVTERLDYELSVIKNMGFAGYFLIVQDFIGEAKRDGVFVGPGRGSAAGSAVAYTVGITNIDPIKYNLLFERFLNPERISMPDIDIDFDDEGRSRVIDYVIRKYGKDKVAQIITYGKMAAKSSIKDVSRVLDYPLDSANALAKLVPERPGTSLSGAFNEVKELSDIYKEDPNKNEASNILHLAKKLEGSIRQRGIHAAGVIIAPKPLTDCLPVCTAKDSDLLVTQFDGRLVEDAGMLKMDFLGLRTLSILKTAIELILRNHKVKIELDDIPLDDLKTYELFQRGETVGIFQFESDGMQKYLVDLKPNNIEDLIAMNALYRPGPMDNIPDFVDRKHGRKAVEYPHESLEGILKNTYGIMVYQEQIMQAAQILADYSLGEADILRKIMGKKKLDMLEKEKENFVPRAVKKGLSEELAEEIYKLMAKFGEYGFNRSHSAAYSVLAYQSGYLKANYPEEFMAAIMTHNMSDISKIQFFLTECHRMGIQSLGPDINESLGTFNVNEHKHLRFGLAAIKGVGAAVVEAIVQERDKNGRYEDIFDLTKRVGAGSLNRKCLESLGFAGSFDSWGVFRSQYFHKEREDQPNLFELALKYGAACNQQESSMANSLFGNDGLPEPDKPAIPDVEPWSIMQMLRKEKEVTGMYVTGHPLDKYKYDIAKFCNTQLIDLKDTTQKGSMTFAGIITSVSIRENKNGNKYASFTLEDYTGSHNFTLFNKDYLIHKPYLEVGTLLYCQGLYKPGYGNDGRVFFNLTNVELLHELREKRVQGIILTVPVERVDNALMQKIESSITSHPGQLKLKFNIISNQKKIRVELTSRKHKIGVNEGLIDALDEINGVQVSLS